MPRVVRLTPEAQGDLAAIHRWQNQPGSGARAVRRLRTIGAALRRLQSSPRLYARGAMPGTRELGIEGHRVVYQVTPDTCDTRQQAM
jgi:plasmid stabilization system protein ParE